MGKHILIVEDDPELAIMWNYLLERYGYVVQSAHNSQQALKSYQQHPADLVMTDYYLPGGYGTDLLQRIHALATPRPVSVLITSDPYFKPEAFDDIVDAFILKPARPSQVMDLVRMYLPPIAS